VAKTDSGIREASDAIFADCGLTSATDAVTFDAVSTRIHDTVLPKLCTPLQQYYSDKLEPMLRQNMEASCAGWTNNAAESINHVLKQRVQWRVSQMPELIGKCRQLVDAQHTEADRALVGRGDLVLRKAYACHRTTLDLWRSLSERQKQRLRNECFRIQSPHTTSTSTDGLLTVNSRSCAGKKMNQRKRRCAERTATSVKRQRVGQSQS